MTPITTNFREELRYEYLLDEKSIVIDAGGYQGRFAEEIVRRYNCRVFSFEPVFYRHCHNTDKITTFPVGFSSRFMMTDFAIKGDMTGRWAQGEAMPVVLVDIREVVRSFDTIDLLKLNIEGGEFECLNALIDAGLQARIKNIQVQFHPIFPDAEEKWRDIRAHLLASHHLTYDFPWTWENYALND